MIVVRAWWMLAVVGVTVCAQQLEKLSQNPCTVKQTCHECIRTPTCSWCAQPLDDVDKPLRQDFKRCFQAGSSQSQCRAQYIVNPDNEYTALVNRQLSKGRKTTSTYTSSSTSYSGSSSSSSSFHKEAVQIAPQKIALKLRMNEAYRISVFFTQAEDYPVDLYYLMDLSKSMEDDKNKLSSLGNILAESMSNITSNFRLGFGSFVDKVVMPYVSTVPKKLAEPCDNCMAPYGFRNHMKLTTETDKFNTEVGNARVSGNLDAPEGGFDAIMQAVVCENDIGWREKARHLLVFSTDAGFHYAGDGKLGGIVKPNDGLCHLDNAGLYNYSTYQDYPSISQINLKVKEKAINVIFAVTAEQENVYKRLSDHVEGSSSGILSNDSSNVVELVKDQYNKITSEVVMKDSVGSNAVKLTYFSNCLNHDGPLENTNECKGLKVGDDVEFKVDVEVVQCPEDSSKWKEEFKIYPVGLNEQLSVSLEMLCACPCELPGHPDYEEKSDKCNNAGTYKCGVCECDSNHFGRQCECDNSRPGHEADLTAGCRPDNTTNVDCSGRGTCVCGQCDCEPRANPEEKISGQYCECDNFSCDRHNGLLCSGPDHGTCECGKCKCAKGWTGNACDCQESTATCVPPMGGEICSGRGECKCGVCKCNEYDQGRYSGRYCEKCPTCPGRCNEFKDCVQCQVYKTGPLTEEECAANCTFVPETVEVVEDGEDLDENFCAFYDEDDCRFAFIYTYDDKGKLIVKAQKERECPPQIHVLGIVLGVIGAIVLIGLALLLLWKLVTTIHDRREFAKFEKERSMAKWDTGENPIYKQATSTFKNPTYAGK